MYVYEKPMVVQFKKPHQQPKIEKSVAAFVKPEYHLPFLLLRSKETIKHLNGWEYNQQYSNPFGRVYYKPNLGFFIACSNYDLSMQDAAKAGVLKEITDIRAKYPSINILLGGYDTGGDLALNLGAQFQLQTVAFSPYATPLQPQTQGPGNALATVYHIVGDMLSIQISPTVGKIVRVDKHQSVLNTMFAHGIDRYLSSDPTYGFLTANQEDLLLQPQQATLSEQYPETPDVVVPGSSRDPNSFSPLRNTPYIPSPTPLNDQQIGFEYGLTQLLVYIETVAPLIGGVLGLYQYFDGENKNKEEFIQNLSDVAGGLGKLGTSNPPSEDVIAYGKYLESLPGKIRSLFQPKVVANELPPREFQNVAVDELPAEAEEFLPAYTEFNEGLPMYEPPPEYAEAIRNLNMVEIGQVSDTLPETLNYMKTAEPFEISGLRSQVNLSELELSEIFQDAPEIPKTFIEEDPEFYNQFDNVTSLAAKDSQAVRDAEFFKNFDSYFTDQNAGANAGAAVETTADVTGVPEVATGAGEVAAGAGETAGGTVATDAAAAVAEATAAAEEAAATAAAASEAIAATTAAEAAAAEAAATAAEIAAATGAELALDIGLEVGLDVALALCVIQ